MFSILFSINFFFFKKKINEIISSFLLKKIDYIRFTKTGNSDIYVCNMGKFMSYYKLSSCVPETFKDNYFQKKELENLLEHEILNYL